MEGGLFVDRICLQIFAEVETQLRLRDSNRRRTP